MTSCYPHHLNDIRDWFGVGRIRRRRPRKEKHRVYYELAIDGKSGKKFLETILPYLKEKRYQAETALRMFRYPHGCETHKALLRELRRSKKVNY